MKKLFLLSALVVSTLGMLSCEKHQENRLEKKLQGQWNLIEARVNKNDAWVDISDAEDKMVITGNHIDTRGEYIIVGKSTINFAWGDNSTQNVEVSFHKSEMVWQFEDQSEMKFKK